jgi:hypothetical protein
MTEIAQVNRLDEFYSDDDEFPDTLSFIGHRKTYDKTQGVVLSQIRQSAPGTLLATASSPRVLIDLIPDIAMPVLEEKLELVSPKLPPKKKSKASDWKYIPIGLPRCDAFHSLNTMMQLILFLPGFRELFSFAPRSFQPLSTFIDQYQTDQFEHRSVSSADPTKLLRCLMSQLPSHLFRFRNRIEIHEIIFALVKACFPQLIDIPSGYDFIGLHPEWHIFWDVSLPFSLVAENHLVKYCKHPRRPPELLVSEKNKGEAMACQLIQRQFFTQPDARCYDLDAFIEGRPDGSQQTHYVAYLKIDGTWFQCDDERISTLRSTSLNVPLHRSLLLHYKRVDLSTHGWN